MNLQHIPFKSTLKGGRSYLLSFKNAQAWKKINLSPRSCKHKKLKIDLLFDPRGERAQLWKLDFSRYIFSRHVSVRRENYARWYVCRCIRFNFFEAFRRIARVQRKVEQPKTFKTCGIHIYTVLKIRNCYVTGSPPRCI